MSISKHVALAVIAIGAAVPLARAADQANTMSPAQSAATQDFGMLSKQGALAYRSVRMARLAIFDGQIGKAKQDMTTADAAFAKAGNDASAYTKAESDLTPPAGMTQPKTGDADTAMTGPVKWLPVDGAMAVDENYAAVPSKKSGMDKADQQIKNGDKKGALDTLKLAGVDVTFDMVVIPLDRSVSKAQQATDLLNAGHYYEANQALKSLEDGARLDMASFTGTPKATAGNAPGAKDATKQPTHDAN